MEGFQKVLVMFVIAGMFATAVAPESQTTRLATALGNAYNGWLRTVTRPAQHA